MEISLPVIWLAATVVLSLIEIFTMGLVTIWFAAGSVAAFIVSLFDTPIYLQLAVFLVVSITVLVLVRPIAASHFNNRLKKTNIDAIIGRKLIAKEDIDNLHGKGKVDMDGTTWLAVSSVDNVCIHAGEEVRVVAVKGVKLIVEREVT